MVLELLLVRHGVTVMNETRRWQGWEDTPLSELGAKQARRAAQALAKEWAPVTAFYCSPLRRALDTAQAVGVALGMQPVAVDGLRECDFGEVSGLTIGQIEAKHPGILGRWADASEAGFAWPDGESRQAFFARVRGAVDEIVRREQRGRVVIVAHGGSLRAALHYLLPDELPAWWDIALANCSLTLVRIHANGPALICLNATSHLTDLATPDTVSRWSTETPSLP